MKNSKEYSRKVQKLYRLLKRKHGKCERVIYDEPLEAIVYGIISEQLSVSATKSAIKRFGGYFVDLNDLRVSRAEEIVEMLGEDTPVTRDIALSLKRSLMTVFNKYNFVSLEELKKIGKRPARVVLEKFDTLSNFVIDYCMLTSLGGHAIPLTDKMIEYLKAESFVHTGSDEKEIEGFLTRQISAKNAYEFYVLLREVSESYKPKRKKAVKARKVSKKTPKVKAKKKKALKSKSGKKVNKTKVKKKAKKAKKVKKTKKRKKKG